MQWFSSFLLPPVTTGGGAIAEPGWGRNYGTLSPRLERMPILTIRLFGEFLATDQRGNRLAMGSRRAQSLLTWLSLHRDTPIVPLQDFGALFGVEDVAALARELRFGAAFPSGQSSRWRQGERSVSGPELSTSTPRASIRWCRQDRSTRCGRLPSSIAAISSRASRAASPLLINGWRASGSTTGARRFRCFGKLLAVQIKAGWWESAFETARRLLTLDPTQEVVHRTLMRLQLEQGRPDSAMRRYQECADILRREFNREPTSETGGSTMKS